MTKTATTLAESMADFEGSDFSDGVGGAQATFNSPTGVAISPNGSKLYVTDSNRIREIHAVEGQAP